ncbi:MAG: acylphosphatase [Planctomycetota bacterium]
MALVARHVFVSGRVQGVAFRWYAHDRASELGVAGWVRNLADGRVEAWVEGEAAAVEAMCRWLAAGPPHARVTDAEVREDTPRGCTGFDIRNTVP